MKEYKPLTVTASVCFKMWTSNNICIKVTNIDNVAICNVILIMSLNYTETEFSSYLLGSNHYIL